MTMTTKCEAYEELNCPICFEIPEDKVFLCQNGHLLCDKCCVEVAVCPQCRVSLETLTVRNRTLEILMDSLKFDCSNKINGCQEQLGRKQIREHSYNCLYKDKSARLVRFCKIIGYHECDFIANLLNVSSALEHFQKSHGFVSRQELKFPINMKNFLDVAHLTVTANSSTMFKSVVVDASKDEDDIEILEADDSSSSPILKTGDSVFVVLCWIHGAEKNASWSCVSMSPGSSLDYNVQFKISSFSAKVPDLTWTTPVINLEHSASILPSPPIRVPIDYLKQHFIKSVDKSVLVTVNIFIPGEKKLEEESSQRNEAPHTTQLSMNHVVSFDRQIQNQSLSTSTSLLSPISLPVVFEGKRCDDCGKDPITDVRYQLPSMEINYCKKCAVSERNGHPWFILIKNVDQGTEDANDIWWKKLRSWCIEGFPFGEKRVVKCITPDCRRRAMYTCLQCNDTGHGRLCEDCMDERSKSCDHVFAMCKEL